MESLNDVQEQDKISMVNNISSCALIFEGYGNWKKKNLSKNIIMIIFYVRLSMIWESLKKLD